MEKSKDNNKKYWCYILRNTDVNKQNCSYYGFTTNPLKRIRQHNREISGGAKATRNGHWEFIFLMTGFKTYNNALSCEWKLKHPNGKRQKNKKYCGANGRITSINEVLQLDKWTNQCDILNYDCEYKIYVINDIYDKLDKNIPENFTIEIVENLLNINI